MGLLDTGGGLALGRGRRVWDLCNGEGLVSLVYRMIDDVSMEWNSSRLLIMARGYTQKSSGGYSPSHVPTTINLINAPILSSVSSFIWSTSK